MREGKGKKIKSKNKNAPWCSRRLFPFALLLSTFSLLPATASPAAVRVYAKVEAETAIYPGEPFAYSVVVEGGKPSKVDISPLAPFNPRSAGSGTSMQMVNDRMTVGYSENYAITAAKAGVLHLPAVTVVVDGQTYTTNAVDVTVSQPGATDQMTLEFSLSEKQCFVGQPLVMTVKWAIIGRAEGGVFDVPVFQSGNFYMEDVSEPVNAQSIQQIAIQGIPVTIVGGRQLIRGMEADSLSFSKVLIPKQAGHLRLDPITASANLAVGRERTGDFFNPYRLKFQRVSVQSNPVELDVRPLPETGKPPQFYGLVGQYTITASATPTKVNVGDPITLTIRIGGNPYLKPVQWPALEQVPELAANFKIPAEKASPTLEGGCKIFTQTLRANSDKVTQVPAHPAGVLRSGAGRLHRGQDGADQARGRSVEGVDERRCPGCGPAALGWERNHPRGRGCHISGGDSQRSFGQLLRPGGAAEPELVDLIHAVESRLRRVVVNPPAGPGGQFGGEAGRPNEPGISRPQTPAPGGRRRLGATEEGLFGRGRAETRISVGGHEGIHRRSF